MLDIISKRNKEILEGNGERLHFTISVFNKAINLNTTMDWWLDSDMFYALMYCIDNGEI